ncbi:prepilin-type cleavage/methylation domain-containing protein [Kribbella sandramycini]|nr:prepilin-type cleavage/methylation domain-containing protein [Kribbella sandramycini]
MALMGVVSLALADLVTTALRQISATSDRMDMAQDAQLSATYFARDVAAMGLRDYGTVGLDGSQPFKQSVQLAAPFAAGGVTCGPLPDAAVRLLSDHWDTSVTPAVRRTAVVAYYLKPVGPVSELHRATCVGPSVTPTSDVRVAANVKPGSLSVTCSTACTSAAVPRNVTVRLLLTKSAAGEQEVLLSGIRRQS